MVRTIYKHRFRPLPGNRKDEVQTGQKEKNWSQKKKQMKFDHWKTIKEKPEKIKNE